MSEKANRYTAESGCPTARRVASPLIATEPPNRSPSCEAKSTYSTPSSSAPPAPRPGPGGPRGRPGAGDGGFQAGRHAHRASVSPALAVVGCPGRLAAGVYQQVSIADLECFRGSRGGVRRPTTDEPSRLRRRRARRSIRETSFARRTGPPPCLRPRPTRTRRSRFRRSQGSSRAEASSVRSPQRPTREPLSEAPEAGSAPPPAAPPIRTRPPRPAADASSLAESSRMSAAPRSIRPPAPPRLEAR